VVWLDVSALSLSSSDSALLPRDDLDRLNRLFIRIERLVLAVGEDQPAQDQERQHDEGCG
jgi:hypothetical protein